MNVSTGHVFLFFFTAVAVVVVRVQTLVAIGDAWFSRRGVTV